MNPRCTPVLFFDPAREPRTLGRGAVIVGETHVRGVYHLAVFSDPDHDFGFAAVAVARSVPLLEHGQRPSSPLRSWCWLCDGDQPEMCGDVHLAGQPAPEPVGPAPSAEPGQKVGVSFARKPRRGGQLTSR